MNEKEQIEKFDPSTLMDGVKSRIKATFVSLIPDAQWEQMCDTEMQKFFIAKDEKDYNGRNTGKVLPSDFQVIVTELMKEKCREFLLEILKDPKYDMSQVWKSSPMGGSNQIELSEHLDNMIKEQMPNMLQTMVSQSIGNAFYQFFAQAQQSIKQY